MAIHLDGIIGTLSNAVTGLGDAQYDPTQNFTLRLMPGNGMSREEQSEAVRQFGLLRKVVTTIPKAATAQWGEVALAEGDRKQIDAIARAMQKLPGRTLTRRMTGARKAFQLAMIDAFRSGNAGIVMDVDDGRDISEPIDLKNIKSLRKLYVMDRWSIQPDLIASSGLTHYTITQISGMYTQRIFGRVHHSRVLWLAGAEADDLSRQYNGGCDDSILEGVMRAFILYLSGIEGAARMIQDYDVFVHKIQGLMNDFGLCGGNDFSATAGGGSATASAGDKLLQRLRLNQRSRSMFKGYVIDKDAEELGTVTRSAGGYSDLVDTVKGFLQASTEYPPAILFGEFSSGLDSSGKSQEEKQLWNETIGQVQVEKLDHLLIGSIEGDDPSPGLLQIICLAKDGPTKGRLPESLGWKWREVYPPGPGDQADLEQKRAQVAQTLAGLDPNFGPQAILSHYGGQEYSPDITLSPEYRKSLEEAVKTIQSPEGEQGGEAGGSEGEAGGQEGEATGSEGEAGGNIDDITDEQIEAMGPDEAAALLAQLEGGGDSDRADSADWHTDAAPNQARQLCKAAIAQNPSGRFVTSSALNFAQAMANGQPVSHQTLEYMGEWLSNHSRFAKQPKGSMMRTAYDLRGGEPLRKWYMGQAYE